MKMHKLKRRKVTEAIPQLAAHENGGLVPHSDSDNELPSEVSTHIMCGCPIACINYFELDARHSSRVLRAATMQAVDPATAYSALLSDLASQKSTKGPARSLQKGWHKSVAAPDASSAGAHLAPALEQVLCLDSSMCVHPPHLNRSSV